RFAQGGLDARHVTDAERDGVGVEMPIWKLQQFGVALGKRDTLLQSKFCGALAADGEHVRIDVADHGMKAIATGLGGAESDVAGAAGDVEQRERARALRWIE